MVCLVVGANLLMSVILTLQGRYFYLCGVFCRILDFSGCIFYFLRKIRAFRKWHNIDWLFLITITRVFVPTGTRYSTVLVFTTTKFENQKPSHMFINFPSSWIVRKFTTHSFTFFSHLHWVDWYECCILIKNLIMKKTDE